MKKTKAAWLVLGMLGAVAPASAQTFPSKTITIVSPAPAGGVTDIIGRALAKQKPGEINYGTYGIGSSGHLNMVLLETMAGLKLQAIHYKGAAPVLNDVLAGHIQMGFVSAGSAVQQWKGGLLKMIAVGGKKRIPQLPDIPTVAETVPGFEAVSWFGLFGPAGMPPETVAKINKEVRELFADPEFQQTFLDRYLFQSIAGSPEDLMSFVKSEE